MSNIPIDNSNIEDRHNLELYVKHKLSSVNKLENVMIYCRNKNNEGEQIIITFFKTCYSLRKKTFSAETCYSWKSKYVPRTEVP